MRPLSTLVQKRFVAHLKRRNVPENAHVLYLKRLRYYLDFCEKYRLPSRERTSLHGFLHKLRVKKQPPAFQHQAHHSVALYYDAFSPDEHESSFQSPQEGLSIGSSHSGCALPARPSPRQSSNSAQANPSFQKSVKGLRQSIQVLKLSRGIGELLESGICSAVRRDQAAALLSQDPEDLHPLGVQVSDVRSEQGPKTLTTEDVKCFSTFPRGRVAGFSSNSESGFQCTALLSSACSEEGVWASRGGRAKRKPCIPVVFSRNEVHAFLEHLAPPFDLVVKLLYGRGLRLFEYLHLRIHCFNFDGEILTVYDGKGGKDWTVPLPKTILPELGAHLESLKGLHQSDLDRGHSGVFLINALEKKYPNAAKDFSRQWFFPAPQLTRIPSTGQLRRYHLHETLVQKTIKQAVGKARITTKRASAHTFRHSFASHLLQANYDI